MDNFIDKMSILKILLTFQIPNSNKRHVYSNYIKQPEKIDKLTLAEELVGLESNLIRAAPP